MNNKTITTEPDKITIIDETKFINNIHKNNKVTYMITVLDKYDEETFKKSIVYALKRRSVYLGNENVNIISVKETFYSTNTEVEFEIRNVLQLNVNIINILRKDIRDGLIGNINVGKSIKIKVTNESGYISTAILSNPTTSIKVTPTPENNFNMMSLLQKVKYVPIASSPAELGTQPPTFAVVINPPSVIKHNVSGTQYTVSILNLSIAHTDIGMGTNKTAIELGNDNWSNERLIHNSTNFYNGVRAYFTGTGNKAYITNTGKIIRSTTVPSNKLYEISYIQLNVPVSTTIHGIVIQNGLVDTVGVDTQLRNDYVLDYLYVFKGNDTPIISNLIRTNFDIITQHTTNQKIFIHFEIPIITGITVNDNQNIRILIPKITTPSNVNHWTRFRVGLII